MTTPRHARWDVAGQRLGFGDCALFRQCPLLLTAGSVPRTRESQNRAYPHSGSMARAVGVEEPLLLVGGFRVWGVALHATISRPIQKPKNMVNSISKTAEP